MNIDLWYYLGIFLISLSVLGGLVAIVIFSIKKKKLEQILEEEYGKHENLNS